jgi:Acetoacetate decarboxylase (ADC)
MVSFIQRVDDPEIPPPYKFPGVTIMSFQLPAKQAHLQKLCNQLLNIGSLADRGFEYRAFTDFVDMEIVTYPKMMFDQLPYSQWGYATQQELYFRFYVWRFNLFGGLLFPELFPQLCFPFIYVDNSWSMISGRNVIGYPKVIAQFDPTPMLGANPLQITASALAMKTHSPTTELKMHPIVEINPSQAAPALPNGIWPWVGLAAQASILDSNLQQQFQNFLAADPGLCSTVQLKQFRDLPTGACFQAVVETPFTPSNIGVPQPLPPVSVTVHPYASLNIPRSLGFPANVALQPALQYSISLDMSMQNGSDLFINS